MPLLSETDQKFEEIKLKPQDGISFELERKVEELENLINSGNELIKLTGKKVRETFDIAVKVDGYSEKQAYEFMKHLLRCGKKDEVMSIQWLRKLVPEEAKNLNMRRSSSNNSKNNNKNCETSFANSSNETINLNTSYEVQDVETSNDDDNDNNDTDKEKLINNSLILNKAENIIKEVYPQLEDGIVSDSDLIKDLQLQLKTKDKEIKKLKAEIKELNLQLVEKRQNEIIRFSKDLEYNDKALPLIMTCYHGGSADEHIVLLDIKRLKEMKNNQ